MAQAKAGQLISIESGAYSDYRVDGFFVVLRDFDPKERLDAFLAANADQADDYHFDGEKFLAAMLADGLLLEISYAVLHMENYGSPSEFNFTPLAPLAVVKGMK